MSLFPLRRKKKAARLERAGQDFMGDLGGKHNYFLVAVIFKF
tara:strand:- start:730 stop:855 length:126 start_codon:yes stop_codon:yes gene_type:complete